jgi:hypothetical protein
VSDFGLKSSRPGNLAPFALQVYEVLAKHTAFPWPVMMAQCRRANVEPTNLNADDLEKVVEFMAEAVARFTSPEKGMAVRTELRLLAKHRPERS